jgi:alkylated DNA nucleotide flippase Atl1
VSGDPGGLRAESDKLSRQLDSDAAVKANRALLERAAGDAVATNRLGIGLLKRGEPAEALDVLEAGLRANPRNTIMLRRADEARKALTRRTQPLARRASAGDARIVSLSRCVPAGRWTTYGTISEIVFGHSHGARTVGSVLRAEGHVDSAHRTLKAGGLVTELSHGVQLHSVGPGPDECLARLRAEATWYDAIGRARPERFVGADELRRHETDRLTGGS